MPNKTCEQSERDDFRLDAGSGGAQLSLAGDYRCRACNELGNATINFTVIVQGRCLPSLTTEQLAILTAK